MENKRVYKVYVHIAPNNKKYVGITRQAVQKRWGSGGIGYKKQPYFYKAISKYGWNNFKHEILLCNLTKEEAEMFEIEIIKYYRSNNRECGYNNSNGGNNIGTHTQETKEKIRHALTGKPKSEHHKSMFRGKNNPMFGKKHTRKTIEKMLIKRIGRKNSPETIDKMIKSSPNKKKVVCVETEIIYDSIREASRTTGISRSSIKQVLNSGSLLRTAGGFHWVEYAYLKNVGILYIKNKIMSKYIVNIETGEIFLSQAHAARALNISPGNVSLVCNNFRKTTKGYKLMCYEEYIMNNCNE